MKKLLQFLSNGAIIYAEKNISRVYIRGNIKMKSVKIWGISAAAAVLLCGCTNTELRNPTSSGSSQTGSSQTGSAGTSSSSGSGSESVDYSSSSVEAQYTISKKNSVPASETFEITKEDTLTIEKGGELAVDGTFSCETGGKIAIKNGGALILNTDTVIDGDITIEKGGKLIIGANAALTGNGSITVEDSFDDIECSGSVKVKIIPPAPITENGVTRVGGVLIVNKKYSIPSDFGSELILDDDAGTGLIIDDAYDALLEMREASGYEMPIVSGFRSYRTQTAIFNNYVANYGEAEANTFSARPGESEHQTGMAIDISSLSQSYGDTEEGMWLGENCHNFGFIIRFQKDKEAITGYIYEPWHVRYLGKSTARLVHDSGLALEEFLGVEG